ncbi:hypothetical protein CAC42_2592 [Sphaceloma murrayae]|uniref:Uncharacterized protein n=1 Tax=Sphaceloma murrayae TaxID=2082308 RepID=A0A2K1QWI3_9PEZI|nr:hypothetical protein CAC42_2592 [Sphaceloma murrayae]
MESPKMMMLAPIITVDEDGTDYFSLKPRNPEARKHSIATPPIAAQRRGSAMSKVPTRKQSVITNVVVPTHLLNSVTSSAEYASIHQERKRRESKARLDPREHFDAEAFANTQSAAVLRALGKGPSSRSQRSSVSLHRRAVTSRRGSSRPQTGFAPDDMLGVPMGNCTPGIPRTPGTPGTAGGILRMQTGVGRVPPNFQIAIPTPTLAVPGAVALRKKSMVTFGDLPTPSERAVSLRKKSVATFSPPYTPSFHTPMIQTPLSEAPKLARTKSIISITQDFDVSYEDKKVASVDVKSFLSQDYFGDYAMQATAPRPGSHAHGPLDTPSTLRPETPGRQTGWRWGGGRTPISDPTSLRDTTRRNTSINAGRTPERRESMWVRTQSIWQDTMSTVADTVQTVTRTMRRGTIHDVYDRAKVRGEELERSQLFMTTFEYVIYGVLLAFVYFVFIGMPLWHGTAYWIWYAMKKKLNVPGTWAIFVGIAMTYAYTPLLVFFEKDLPMPEDITKIDPNETPGVKDTCLLIPCYKSENIIGPTLLAATRIFPPSHIFVIANGNSPTPLDATEDVCQKYGVNHVWSPVGSKIVAQFVGCYAAKGFKNVLLIDDDCALPPNFPIVSNRLVDQVKCMGYTIKSVGPNSSRGTLAQQAQDIEYKLSGLQRELMSRIGSALFPHGAISLWDREFLIKTFHQHPGFNVSEDWFFGHVARELGCRTKMCTSVFIETETPDSVFLSSGGARGGFGEMTVFKQRFTRWNFFFVNGMYYNLAYILFSWKLGWWELGTKLFCIQEIYETLLYLAMPLIVPITFYVRPLFATYMFLGTCALYFVNVLIFNEVHLRRKGERVPSFAAYVYYMPYKLVLTFVNVASCYYALFKYATYFAKRHPKVIEDERAVGVVLQLEEARDDDSFVDEEGPTHMRAGRRMTVTAIGAQTQIPALEDRATGRRMTVTTLGPRMDGAVSGIRRPSVDSPAVLTVGSRKFSVPSRPGLEGLRRMSSSGPISPGFVFTRARVGSLSEEEEDEGPFHTPRSGSEETAATGTTRGRLFSVAEVGDEEAEDKQEEKMGSARVRRKSNAPRWVMELARKASVGVGRRKSRAGSVGGEEVPDGLLDTLAGVQSKLIQNRVEVLEFCIDGGVVLAETEEQGGPLERKRTTESRSMV